MPFQTRGVWLLMAYTGVRISDALNARVNSFDEKGYFHYVSQKTGKKGRAKVPGTFVSTFIDQKAKPDDYIFPSKSVKRVGKPVTRQTVFKHIKKACVMCGYNPDGIAPHTARKNFAVDLYREKGLGVTMNALQHRDASTTLLYAMSDDPLTEYNSRVQNVENSVENLIEEMSLINEKIDKLFNVVFGDIRYEITEKGKKALSEHKKRE